MWCQPKVPRMALLDSAWLFSSYPCMIIILALHQVPIAAGMEDHCQLWWGWSPLFPVPPLIWRIIMGIYNGMGDKEKEERNLVFPRNTRNTRAILYLCWFKVAHTILRALQTDVYLHVSNSQIQEVHLCFAFHELPKAFWELQINQKLSLSQSTRQSKKML